MKSKLNQAASYCWQWFIVGIVTNIATLLLLLPAAIPAWLLYTWLAPRVGLPALGFLEVAAAIYLIRLTQASASINVPPTSQMPDRGVRQ